jgi:hypothetical protein
MRKPKSGRRYNTLIRGSLKEMSEAIETLRQMVENYVSPTAKRKPATRPAGKHAARRTSARKTPMRKASAQKSVAGRPAARKASKGKRSAGRTHSTTIR